MPLYCIDSSVTLFMSMILILQIYKLRVMTFSSGLINSLLVQDLLRAIDRCK